MALQFEPAHACAPHGPHMHLEEPRGSSDPGHPQRSHLEMPLSLCGVGLDIQSQPKADAFWHLPCILTSLPRPPQIKAPSHLSRPLLLPGFIPDCLKCSGLAFPKQSWPLCPFLVLSTQSRGPGWVQVSLAEHHAACLTLPDSPPHFSPPQTLSRWRAGHRLQAPHPKALL